MNANAKTVSVNSVKNVSYNIVDGIIDNTTYRVTLNNSIRGYRTNADGVRTECDVVSFLIPRNVFLAQTLNKLFMLARVYSAKLEALKAKEDYNGEILDFTNELTTWLKDGVIELNLEYHAAGEIQELADGSTVEHKMDKINIAIANIEYGPIGVTVVAEIEAKERAKAIADAMSILGL